MIIYKPGITSLKSVNFFRAYKIPVNPACCTESCVEFFRNFFGINYAYVLRKKTVYGNWIFFYRNGINIGLPIIECPEAAKAINAGDEVTVDFDSGIITDETTGEKFKGQAFPPFMQKIIDCEGLVNYINQK